MLESIKNMKLTRILIFLVLASCQRHDVCESPLIIEKLNNQNSEIQSVSCRLSSSASISDLFYEKPNKIFLKTYFLGKEEAKVSSDGQNYWFWIRNFDPKCIYYTPLENLEETRVIDPLRPDMIKSLLCIDEIPNENTLVQDDNAVQIFFVCGSYRRLLIVKDGKIKEQHWYSFEDKPLLSIYVINQDIIPSLIKVIWHEQNYKVKISMSQVKINPKEKPKYDMPEMKKKNLKDY
jgi:outer membrane lipoprotein-sorting protein